MNSLHEMQRDFSGFVWSGHESAVAGVVANGIQAERRLALYRNNTMLGLTEALRAVYPVLGRLVGDDFFKRLSREFILAWPPRAGSLLVYSNRMPDFLAAWPPVANLPYLADTAWLEWFRHEVYHESDEPAVGIADLRLIPEESYGTIRFGLHPTVRMLESRFPIERIWRLNQDGSTADDRVDLNEGVSRLLVCRPEWEVEMISIDESSYRFFKRLEAGSTLNEAVSDALSINPNFDVSTLLQLALSKALFAHFTLD